MTPRLTGLDLLRLQRYVTLPMIFGGSVAPNPRFWPWLVRHRATETMIQFLHGVRRKYGPRAWSWFPGGSTLLVFDRAGIEEVLGSEDNFADPGIKKFQLSTFTPHGVIISRKEPWHTRRGLNEDVLAFGHPCHPAGQLFVDIVREEVRTTLGSDRKVLVWNDFATLAARISQQVIFGRGMYREDVALHLARLAAGSNWGLRPSSDFSAFFGHIDEGLKCGVGVGGCRSLVQQTAARLGANPQATDAEPSSQIAFWLFVMKDAIELHVVRTLALIASAPEIVRERLAQEFRNCAPLTTANAITQLRFLEACVEEQLRLWTPVPILLRVAVTRTTLGQTELSDAVRIENGQQIMVHTGSYHRDPEVFGATANRFSPEKRLLPGPPLYVFSRHRQSCAGQFLVMFLLKAVLANLLVNKKFELGDQQIPMDRVPAAIDNFAIRFWRR